MSGGSWLSVSKNPEFVESEIWAVMMLCNSGASLSTQLPQDARRRRSLQPRAISPVENQRAREIRAMPAVHNRGGIVQAARWMYAVMEAWKKKAS